MPQRASDSLMSVLLSRAGLPGLPGAATYCRQHQDMAQVAQERAGEGDHSPGYARRHAAGRPHVRPAELQGCLYNGPDELGAQVGDARDDARQAGVDLCQHQGGAAGSLDGPRACAARAHDRRPIRVRQAGQSRQRWLEGGAVPGGKPPNYCCARSRSN